jgi:hypothetical protein
MEKAVQLRSGEGDEGVVKRKSDTFLGSSECLTRLSTRTKELPVADALKFLPLQFLKWICIAASCNQTSHT